MNEGLQQVMQDLARFRPEMALVAGLMLVVLLDAFRLPGRDTVCRWVTVLTLAGSLVLCFGLRGASGSLFRGMVVLDPLALFFKMILIGASLVVVLTFRLRNSREMAGL